MQMIHFQFEYVYIGNEKYIQNMDIFAENIEVAISKFRYALADNSSYNIRKITVIESC